MILSNVCGREDEEDVPASKIGNHLSVVTFPEETLRRVFPLAQEILLPSSSEAWSVARLVSLPCGIGTMEEHGTIVRSGFRESLLTYSPCCLPALSL